MFYLNLNLQLYSLLKSILPNLTTSKKSSGLKHYFHCFQANYIKDHNLLGAAVWSVDLDDVSGVCGDGKFPLLHALTEILTADSAIIG